MNFPKNSKKNFKIALSLRSLTQKSFCEKYHLSSPLVTMVLSGKKRSDRVSRIIRNFVNAEFKKLKLENN